MIRHIDLKDVDWLGIKDRLPIESGLEEDDKRKELWLYFDPNENGLVSLAEADLGFRQIGPAMLPIYYSKKVQNHAFKMARNSIPGKTQTNDDYMEKSEFKTFLFFIHKYFGYYFMFKSLDLDFDDRITIDDFIREMVQLRNWGAEIADSKEARKVFHEYDKNNGGILLFDEWIQFCDDHKLNIEKHYLILENSKRPRVIYKKHPFLKAGEKRPIEFERPSQEEVENLKKLQSINIAEQEKKISKQLRIQRLKLKTGENISKKIEKIKPLSEQLKSQLLKLQQQQASEKVDQDNYDKVEKELKTIDEQLINFNNEISALKDELKKQKKFINKQKKEN